MPSKTNNSKDNKLNQKIAPASLRLDDELLRWYDENARDLPWRIAPKPKNKSKGTNKNTNKITGKNKTRSQHKRPNPYHVWLSEIMLQQTTVATVGPRFLTFLKQWPTIHHLAKSPVEDVTGAWAGLGYYARARNLHKCAQVLVADYDGKFPQSEEELKKLPGIGDYTAAAITTIAFNQYALVMDGNIERVTARLYREATPLPAAKPILKEHLSHYWPRPDKQARHGDFAQALMDLGSGICRPKNPLCLLCPIKGFCQAHQTGNPQDYPVKLAKKQKPTRRGIGFVVYNQKGEIALERRADKGLLGGMLGFPGTGWSETEKSILKQESKINAIAPLAAKWDYAGEALHTFTHFHLIMGVYVAKLETNPRRTKNYEWIVPHTAQLPTVMKKALERATDHFKNEA